MLLIPTHLRSSEINGIGVFASEPVKAGAKIWELREGFDIFFHEEDIKTLPVLTQRFLEKYTYPHAKLEKVHVLGSDNDRFMNHDPMPNTNFKDWQYGYAIRDIALDEEITCDYNEFCPNGFVFVE